MGLKNTNDYYSARRTSFRWEQFVQFLKVRNLTWPVIRRLKLWMPEFRRNHSLEDAREGTQ